MDFQKKDWQFRDLIAEYELNRMEDGIEEGITKAEQAQQTADGAAIAAANAQDDIDAHKAEIASLGLGIGITPRQSEDLNNELDTGWVQFYSGTLNAPPSNSGIVRVERGKTGRVVQTAYGLAGGTNPRSFIRFKGDSAWGDWVEIITSNGGTMSGNLTLPAINLSGGSNFVSLEGRPNDAGGLAGFARIFFNSAENALKLRRGTSDSETFHTSGNLPYEEGVWTPSIIGLTTPGEHTYQVQAGTYVKIGNLVKASFRAQIQTKDTSMTGDVAVSGLPFVNVSGEGARAALAVSYNANITLPPDFTQLTGFLIPGTNHIGIYLFGSGKDLTALGSTGIEDGSQLAGTVVYRTSS